MTFKALSKLITALKRFNFSLIDDLPESLLVRIKAISINIFSNPLKILDYLKPDEISLKTFNKAVDTPARIYIIRPTAKEARQ